MSEGPTEQSKSQAHPKTKNYEAVIANWTRVLAASTLALFIATGVSAYFLYRTDQTIATQVEMAKLQMRAYVVIYKTTATVNFDKPTDSSVSSVDVHVTWKNIGYTPAFDFDWFISIGWYANGSEPDFSKQILNQPVGPTDSFAPQGDFTKTITINRPDILKASVGNGKIFVWGATNYRDFAPDSIKHSTAFCYTAEMPTKRGEEAKIIRYKSECNKGN